MQSGEWPGTLGRFTSIRRAWGIGGLFWALFLEQLEHCQIQECSRCGRIIQGNQGKRFVDTTMIETVSDISLPTVSGGPEQPVNKSKRTDGIVYFFRYLQTA